MVFHQVALVLIGFIIVVRIAIGLYCHNRLLGDMVDDKKIKVSAVMGNILALIIVKKCPILDHITHGGMTQDTEMTKIRVFCKNVLEQ